MNEETHINWMETKRAADGTTNWSPRRGGRRSEYTTMNDGA